MEDLIVSCPRCAFELIDADGFGFVFCERCAYCVHPCADRGHDGRLRCLVCNRAFVPESDRRLVEV